MLADTSPLLLGWSDDFHREELKFAHYDMEILFDVILLPFLWMFQGAAGVFWPSDDLGVRTLQRQCAITLALAFASTIAAALFAYFWPDWRILLLFGLAAFVLFGLSGLLGNRIETLCKTGLNAEKRKNSF